MMQMDGSSVKFEHGMLHGIHCCLARAFTPEDEANLMALWKQGISTVHILGHSSPR